MTTKNIPIRLKYVMVKYVIEDGMRVVDAAAALGLSRATGFRILDHAAYNGTLEVQKRRGPVASGLSLLHSSSLGAYVLWLVVGDNTLYLRELQAALAIHKGVVVSVSVISKFMLDHWLTHKKVRLLRKLTSVK